MHLRVRDRAAVNDRVAVTAVTGDHVAVNDRVAVTAAVADCVAITAVTATVTVVTSPSRHPCSALSPLLLSLSRPT